MMDHVIPGTVIALTVAFALAILIAAARGEPKNRWDRDHETHHELGWVASSRFEEPRLPDDMHLSVVG